MMGMRVQGCVVVGCRSVCVDADGAVVGYGARWLRIGCGDGWVPCVRVYGLKQTTLV